MMTAIVLRLTDCSLRAMCLSLIGTIAHITLSTLSPAGKAERFPCHLGAGTPVLRIRSALRYCANGAGVMPGAAVETDYDICFEPSLVSQAHGAGRRRVIRRTPPSVPQPARRPGLGRQT